MLHAELLRELQLPPESHPQQRAWLSAASGLVLAGEYLHVVADDEHHLCSFAFDARHPTTDTPLQLVTLLPEALPLTPKLRKKAKSDLEVLLRLPAHGNNRHDSLLCLGSGGKINRRRALSVPLHTDGTVQPSAVTVHDFSEFFAPLEQHCEDLNIEGAFINGATLALLQRGNKGARAHSACLQFRLSDFLDWLHGNSGKVPPLQALLPLDFGSVLGVPLCPTDAAALPDGGWVATLVAEDTSDSVTDGACVASAIAVMGADNKLSAMHRLQGSPKVEGVAVLPAMKATDPLTLLLVTDADDPAQPSRLLRVRVP